MATSKVLLISEGVKMKSLIEEYHDSLKQVEKTKAKAGQDDQRILANMVSDLNFALEWLKSGRMPGSRRGVERLASYQRERPIDPVLIQTYISNPDCQLEFHVSERDSERIEDALFVLTKREREMYLMSRGSGLSYGEIASLLNVAKSTVQTTINRAEKKIVKNLS